MTNGVVPRAEGSTAVLLFDLQCRFFHRLTDPRQESVTRSAFRLIRECTESGTPLIVIEAERFGPTREEFRRVLTPEMPCVRAKTMNAFEGTDLLSKIGGATRLVFAGINARQAILPTAMYAMRLGFSVSTADDLLADQCARVIDPSVADWFSRVGSYSTEFAGLPDVLVG